MNNLFFPKLAWTNIRRNGKMYVPYMITCIFTIAMFYIIFSLSQNNGIANLIGGSTILVTLNLGSIVTAVFAVIFLFYTNSFLMKRRKHEFGLFNILGMEKKHISIVVACEVIGLAFIAFVSGIGLGIMLDKVMYLGIAKLLGGDIPLGFYISSSAIFASFLLFGFIFFFIFLNSMRQIHISKPIELLHSDQTGEKEPKARWLLAILGLVCLGSAYYISVTTYDPVAALMLFFVAVILVIIGTYLLFTTGSIALLKMLRKNKAYYYKTSHFINVSTMIYRMKQNAVGLANICILITMVLVMISSTSSLILGLDDVIEKRVPYDYSVTMKQKQIDQGAIQERTDKIQQAVMNKGLQENNVLKGMSLNFAAYRDNEVFHVISFDQSAESGDISMLYIMALNDFNENTKQNITLNDQEILLQANRSPYESKTLEIFEQTFHIKETNVKFPLNGMAEAFVQDSYFIIVKDQEQMQWFYDKQKEVYKENASPFEYMYAFNTDANDEQRSDLASAIRENFEKGSNVRLEVKEEMRVDLLSLYGGLFFIGIFLGTLFVMAAILIIYYKQISEGFDDKKRFEIMQKVGLSHTEVKHCIHAQALMVFFLPLVVAGMHVGFAFPVVCRILQALNLYNTNLFLYSTIACFIIVACIYSLIYSITAKSYYRIVSR